MDLDNTIRKDNLVILKQGVEAFRADSANQTEFEPNKYYRCILLENDGHREAIIFGERFVNEEIDEKFETVQDLMIRELEQLNVIVDGKIISKTAFKRLLDVRQFGKTVKSGFKVGVIYTNPKELMYVFMPYFTGDTKVACIEQAYGHIKEIIDGNMDCVAEDYVQRANTGLAIGMKPNHVFKFITKKQLA